MARFSDKLKGFPISMARTSGSNGARRHDDGIGRGPAQFLTRHCGANFASSPSARTGRMDAGGMTG